MKQQKYILKIPHPCSQDWTSMAPNEIGRFCSQCSKTVVDFTHLSDQQIIDSLQKKSATSCLRLTPSQQNRVLISSQKSSKTPKLCKFLSGLLLIGTAQNSIATTTVVSSEKVESIDANKKEVELQMKKVQNEYGTIKVILQDKATHEPIPYANVTVYQDGVQMGVATTNMEGETDLKSLKPGRYSVKGVYVGYQATEIIDVLVSENKTTCLIIPLSNGEGVKLDEVNVMTYQACKELKSQTVSGEDIQISQDVYVMGPYEREYEPHPIPAVERQKTKKWWQFWKHKNRS